MRGSVVAVMESPRRDFTDALRIAVGVGGFVALVVGVLILLWPGKTALVVTAIVGVYLIVVGLGYLGSAVFSRRRSGWGRVGHLLLGALYVVGGILALVYLAATAVSLAIFLAILVGVMWVIEGVVALATLGDVASSKVWAVIFAILSIGAGIVLFISPLWSAVVLWWLLGISLVVLGVVQIVRALTWKPAAAPGFPLPAA